MTKKTLIIAEKPSVAADIAKSLPGKFAREKTHYEGDRYVVTFAIGHLVTICFPEEIDSAYQKWDINTLPILPDSFPLKSVDETKSQLNALQKLIRRQDISEIINACDAGREGELIFKYIIKFVWNKAVAGKTMKRLWLQSMTSESITSAFANLRNNEEMQPLEDTALCRSESDWLIGINATRALTGYNSRNGGFFLTPCGRVQTPTLSLLVKRERLRRDFIPKTYWNLTGYFQADSETYEGRWIDKTFARETGEPTERADRIWKKEDTAAIIERCVGKEAKVEEQSKKSQQNSPPLYDLTLLQREANSRFGFSAKNTLSIAQALYEKHKILTYPRTDSKHLPEDYQQSVKQVLRQLTSGSFGKFAEEVLTKNYVRPDKRIFNNAKISDHHAIIPTAIAPQHLSEAETKIYTMVVQRFLAVFFPPAIFSNTRRLSIIGEDTFLSEGKVLLEAGWKAIYGSTGGEGQDKILPNLPGNSKPVCRDCEVEERVTTPPPRFNEATLLSAMENSDKLVEDEELAEAMKERGLGTPATRAAIIEKLIKEKYVVREGKELAPTGKAFELLALLEAMNIEILASPEMTGEWEYKLNRMLKGKFTRTQFMTEIRTVTSQIIDRVRSYANEEHNQPAPFGPINGVEFISTPTAFISADKKITIRKIIGGRVLTENEVIALLHGETIGPFNDFRSKKGKPFTASIHLNNLKIEFIFAESQNELDVDLIKKGPSLGLSPLDQTAVYATPTAYMSLSALTGNDKKGLKIGKTILAKEITEENVKQLLQQGKTDLITGFISKKKKPFDAYLILEKNGTLRFEFPPRINNRTKQIDSPEGKGHK